MKSIALILVALLFSQWLYVAHGPGNPIARFASCLHATVVAWVVGRSDRCLEQ